MEDKIYLIGMPGCGKSTIGKQLASKLSLPFFDLDLEIEKREMKSIAEIFEQKRETYFRKIESQVLQDFATGCSKFVMATGGGTPCFYDGLQTINNSGVSIFIDVNFNELLKRLKKETNRPLLNSNDLKDKETLLRLYKHRLPYYVQAKITLLNPTIDQIIESL